jgi:multicomponent Na+:H+ antiporter subunit C
MEVLLTLTIGVLFVSGFYLMLRSSLVKTIFGLILFSHGANLLIMTAGGLTRGKSPIIPEGATELAAPYADPLPQALVLTAIVIGFGVLAFFLVLALRTNALCGSDSIEEMEEEE